ncbi:MAG TPA: hypothetical protein VEW26_08830 [Allosphingosinicella sp.]|nr:hypothetical protein [Allosphingosinicella sp.]
MGRFIHALRRGESVAKAAEAAGFNVSSFYRKRRADPDFAAAWAEAMEASNAPRLIRPGNGRRLQLRKTRQLRFTDSRKEIFLAHFAGTCDLAAAAEAAAVSVSTVRNHRLKYPEFDAACDAALEQGYKHLEEEAVRERLAALERLKAGIVPAGEAAAEFDRQIKLLNQWRRRTGRLGPMARSREALTIWSFADAIKLLQKRLKALRIPIAPPPEPESGT